MTNTSFQYDPMHALLRQDPAIWRLFTSEEEYSHSFTDVYDRFPYYMSSNRSVFEPVASRYLCNQGYQIKYPEDQPFVVCLTHDIDVVYRSIPSKGVNAIKSFMGGNIRNGLTEAQSVRSKKIPLWNFQEIMELEEQYGAKSSFYFMALSPGDQDYSYDIRDLKEEIRMIADAGWEIGLHGGHKAWCDPSMLATEKARLEEVLGREVVGYRNHYLRFRTPDTWQHLANAGFSYDTTFGYADCVGFRNGMCHPFRPIDLRTDREINILEIPLTVMDGTLFSYMRLDPEGAWEITRQLIDNVEQCHGVFTLLWHNTYMEGEWVELYEKILSYCYEKGAWMTSGEKIFAAIIQ